MNIVRTLLATVAIVVLGVAAILVFEFAVQPGSEQRTKFGGTVCPALGVVAALLWVWHFKSGAVKRRPGGRD